MKDALHKWARGDPLRSEWLNEPRDALLVLQDQLGARVTVPGLWVPVVARFRVQSVAGDYLVCVRLLGSQAATQTANVAKPFLLRNSTTARGSATYTYSATDTREATVSGDTEDQVIVPSYLASDELYAMRVPRGGTGVSDAPQWLDLNLDARAWAKESA